MRSFILPSYAGRAASLVQVDLLEQRGKTGLRAERIEGPVQFQPPEPLRVGSVSLFHVVESPLAVAETEVHERQVEGRGSAVQRALLQVFQLRQRAGPVPRGPIGVGEPRGNERGRIHGFRLLEM